MNFRNLLFISGMMVVFLFSCQKIEEEGAHRPNIVLILVDDYGYGDISFEGNTQIQTPHIDRIAENGARFTGFYQNAGACAPTRASLLTGRYYLATGVWGVHAGRDFLNRDEITIADELKKAGYATGAFGKWHSGKTWSYFSWNRGFDVGVHSRLYQYFDTRVIFNNKIVNVEGPITDVIGDQAVRFIEENSERPFFAYVPFQAIHEPFNCPYDLFQKYKAAGYTDHVARLYGMIEVMDNNTGKIIKKVEELGLTDNTVFMFLSDDGPSPGFDLSYSNRRMNPEERQERRRAWPIEYRGGKGSIWEGGTITPFYIQWKGRIEAGKDYGHLSGVTDLLPTILDICGLERSPEGLPLHGQSLWPVLNGQINVDQWNERKYYDNTNFYLIPRHEIDMEKPQMHHIALWHKNLKLIRVDNTLYGGPDTVFYELYDLKNDPKETTNIIGDYPDLVTELKSDVEDWYAGILESGRAFNQAVYEVGNWEERSTPVNIDAVLHTTGPVRRSENSSFRYTGWTRPGGSMNFVLDVIETGTYQVEMIYSAGREGTGAVFSVYTEHDTAYATIDDPGSTISGPLQLPAGKQLLHIKLDEMGSGSQAIEVLQNLVVHRIPAEEESTVIRNPGFEIFADPHQRKAFAFSSATVDFMMGREKEPLEVKSGDNLNIIPFAATPDRIKEIRLWLDFERVETLMGPPYKFTLPVPGTGKHTINVEFISQEGIVNSVHGDILVSD